MSTCTITRHYHNRLRSPHTRTLSAVSTASSCRPSAVYTMAHARSLLCVVHSRSAYLRSIVCREQHTPTRSHPRTPTRSQAQQAHARTCSISGLCRKFNNGVSSFAYETNEHVRDHTTHALVRAVTTSSRRRHCHAIAVYEQRIQTHIASHSTVQTCRHSVSNTALPRHLRVRCCVSGVSPCVSRDHNTHTRTSVCVALCCPMPRVATVVAVAVPLDPAAPATPAGATALPPPLLYINDGNRRRGSMRYHHNTTRLHTPTHTRTHSHSLDAQRPAAAGTCRAVSTRRRSRWVCSTSAAARDVTHTRAHNTHATCLRCVAVHQLHVALMHEHVEHVLPLPPLRVVLGQPLVVADHLRDDNKHTHTHTHRSITLRASACAIVLWRMRAVQSHSRARRAARAWCACPDARASRARKQRDRRRTPTRAAPVRPTAGDCENRDVRAMSLTRDDGIGALCAPARVDVVLPLVVVADVLVVATAFVLAPPALPPCAAASMSTRTSASCASLSRSRCISTSHVHCTRKRHHTHTRARAAQALSY
jgi:hypothetical protein